MEPNPKRTRTAVVDATHLCRVLQLQRLVEGRACLQGDDQALQDVAKLIARRYRPNSSIRSVETHPNRELKVTSSYYEVPALAADTKATTKEKLRIHGRKRLRETLLRTSRPCRVGR